MLRRIACAALLFLACGAQAQQTRPAPQKKPAPPAQQTKPPDPAIVGEIFSCLKPGLPQDWKKAWVVMTETDNSGQERNFELQYFFAVSPDDNTGLPMTTPCVDEDVGKRIYGFNRNLRTFEQRQWKVAKLTINKDGKFELKYDYTR